MPLTPPVLNYSSVRRPKRWVARTISLLMLALGIINVVRGLLIIFGTPLVATASDKRVVLHNAWVDVLFGSVLMIPSLYLAICFLVGHEVAYQLPRDDAI